MKSNIVKIENAYMISDLHFQDDHILKYRPEFNTIEEHDAEIKDQWINTISDDDTVFILGDIARSEKGASELKSLPGRKILVLGNWDAPPKVWFDRGYDEVHSMLRLWMYNGNEQLFRTICSHTPIQHELCVWEQNFHGHIHDGRGVYKKHINVCTGIRGYAPLTIESLMAGYINPARPITHLEIVVAE